MTLKNQHILLFDGVCNLCNSTIRYVIKHDKKDRFRFAPLQSQIGKKLLEKHKINIAKTDSIVLVSNGRIYLKSTAAIKIASKLGFPINSCAMFIIIPVFIRNWVYDFVARNRYKWYGKKEHCMLPTPELKRKFLS